MIKSITALNYVGNSLVIDLGDPSTSGLLVTKITGLNPPKANINTTKFATNDGSEYNSANVAERNIVFTFRLIGTPSVEETRVNLYKHFPIKKLVTLTFETDTKNLGEIDDKRVVIQGYVESNEVDIFSNKVTATVSIVCTNPYFESISEIITSFSNVKPLFEFPFDDTDRLEFSELLTDAIRTYYYDGEVETGFIMNIHATDYVSNITLYRMITGESMRINITLEPFDDIIISTVQNHKYVRLLRHGTYTNILNRINRDADWFLLQKGINSFGYTAESGGENLVISIQNKIVYEGI